MANPEYFNAIKDENISTSSANATATMSQFGSMNPVNTRFRMMDQIGRLEQKLCKELIITVE